MSGLGINLNLSRLSGKVLSYCRSMGKALECYSTKILPSDQAKIVE